MGQNLGLSLIQPPHSPGHHPRHRTRKHTRNDPTYHIWYDPIFLIFSFHPIYDVRPSFLSPSISYLVRTYLYTRYITIDTTARRTSQPILSLLYIPGIIYIYILYIFVQYRHGEKKITAFATHTVQIPMYSRSSADPRYCVHLKELYPTDPTGNNTHTHARAGARKAVPYIHTSTRQNKS